MLQFGEGGYLTGDGGEGVLCEDELEKAFQAPHHGGELCQLAEARHSEVVEGGHGEKVAILSRSNS